MPCPRIDRIFRVDGPHARIRKLGQVEGVGRLVVARAITRGNAARRFRRLGGYDPLSVSVLVLLIRTAAVVTGNSHRRQCRNRYGESRPLAFFHKNLQRVYSE